MHIPKFLTLLLLLYSAFASGQQTSQKLKVKGEVVDSVMNIPIGLATLAVVEMESGQPVMTLLSLNDGSFEFYLTVNHSYKLTVDHIGYHSKQLVITKMDSTSGPMADLGKIRLSSSGQQLKEVLVTANRPVIKQEIDRITYNVQADPDSKANDALEMLRKVPLVTVDGNDVIQLKGSANFQIFINGKPSALMTNSPSDVLKSMPAATILKIEVITVPPSKYDAEGIAGIINIITLQKRDGGFTGSLFGRWNSVFGERGSLSFGLKEGRFGLNTLVGMGYQPIKSTAAGSQLLNFSPGSDLSQTGQNITAAKFNNGQATMSYELDSLQLLNASIDFFNRNNTRNSLRESKFLRPLDSLIQSYSQNNTGNNLVGAFDFSANYQLGFSHKKDEWLTLSYQYTSSTLDQHSLLIGSDGLNYTGSNYNQQNSAGSKDQTLQIDFVKPVKAWIIEAGTKAIFRTNHSQFWENNYDSAIGQYITDSSSTNEFEYHQNVYSLYNSYQLNLPNWIIKAGLRLENTVIRSSYPVNQNYFNLVPDISIQRSSDLLGTFTLGYTDRIQRPILQQLNPYIDRSNPEFIVTGNPALHPVVNHIVELGYSKSGKMPINISFNYARAGNSIQNVTSIISDSVSETTYLNVGKIQSGGLNLSANLPVSNRFSININGQLAHLWIIGTYNNQLYKNQGNQGNINAFARYNLGHDLNATLNFGYFSGSVYLQGKSSDYLFTGLNLIKDFLKKKLSLSVTLYDPFQKFNSFSSYSKTPDFQQTQSSQYYYRNLRIAVNYKFGRLNATIKSNHRGIKNDDLPLSGSTEGQ